MGVWGEIWRTVRKIGLKIEEPFIAKLKVCLCLLNFSPFEMEPKPKAAPLPPLFRAVNVQRKKQADLDKVSHQYIYCIYIVGESAS